jgi:hypothetical protein
VDELRTERLVLRPVERDVEFHGRTCTMFASER